MLWPRSGRIGWDWDPWSEFRHLRREVNRLFEGHGRAVGEFPAVSVWRNDDGAVVTAEIPGIDSKDLDITTTGSVLTIRGSRQPDESKEDRTYHRQERGYGRFVRTLQLPYDVDSDKVEAAYEKGVLRLTLPRAEADKPKKIAIAGA